MMYVGATAAQLRPGRLFFLAQTPPDIRIATVTTEGKRKDHDVKRPENTFLPFWLSPRYYRVRHCCCIHTGKPHSAVTNSTRNGDYVHTRHRHASITLARLQTSAVHRLCAFFMVWFEQATMQCAGPLVRNTYSERGVVYAFLFRPPPLNTGFYIVGLSVERWPMSVISHGIFLR